MIRIRLQLHGRLQGVGFRPFVFRLARKLNLQGWIKNTLEGVLLELQGSPHHIREFESVLQSELPELAEVQEAKKYSLPLLVETEDFKILPSDSQGVQRTIILPDVAVCESCLKEIFDPTDRRYNYPFTHCTECGPRYSILKKLPYDRENTSMADFKMCAACKKEYQDPTNRRFYAQTNCCPECGPELVFSDTKGNPLSHPTQALKACAKVIQEGAVIAIQGVGGFHLVCDATQELPVSQLRHFKRRNSKPFALMAQSLQQAEELCEISETESKLLQGKGGPIVLLRRRAHPTLRISNQIAPGISLLGVMLPYSPLHALLMAELKTPVVATSGNEADDPICTHPNEAFARLKDLAKYFLVHNRPIVSRVDDSVVREISGTEVVLRAGRGYAPLALEKENPSNFDHPVLALGAHQKNTIAVGIPNRIVLMPHLGSLENQIAAEAFEKSIAKAETLFGFSTAKSEKPHQWLGDLHPGYFSTRFGQDKDPSLIQIQHHEAHLFSCVAEHQLKGPIFGVAWDGTGFGNDGSAWGGEFFLGNEFAFTRTASLRPFYLPGGKAAIQDIRRCALGILYEIFGENLKHHTTALGLDEKLLRNWVRALQAGINSPQTSSMGRLFDAVAVLAGIQSTSSYEGEAALKLELSAETEIKESYPVSILESSEASFLRVDWEPWVLGILKDRIDNLHPAVISAKFHSTLAQLILKLALRHKTRQVILSGGCFQNRVLCEWTIQALKKEGFMPYWNQKVPPNDGGISVGQVLGGWNVSVRSR